MANFNPVLAKDDVIATPISEDAVNFRIDASTLLENDLGGAAKRFVWPASPVTTEQGGTVTFDPGTNSLYYTAPPIFDTELAAGETATDSFDYTMQVGRGVQSRATVTLNIEGSDDVPAGFVLNPGNGHYYMFVPGELTFAAARQAAADMGGYLATVTSAQENVFLYNLMLASPTNPTGGGWLGGSDAGQEGLWKWVDGPEAGQTFWENGTATGYTNWSPGEPNNFGGDENYLEMDILSSLTGGWNDYPAVNGYFVEIG